MHGSIICALMTKRISVWQEMIQWVFGCLRYIFLYGNFLWSSLAEILLVESELCDGRLLITWQDVQLRGCCPISHINFPLCFDQDFYTTALNEWLVSTDQWQPASLFNVMFLPFLDNVNSHQWNVLTIYYCKVNSWPYNLLYAFYYISMY